jgi:pilus assembly protein CpaF
MKTKSETSGAANRFQKLKAETHRQMVERMDLSKLATWHPDRLREEVRTMAAELAKSAPELQDERERDRLAEEIFDEAFGLGPLEKLMADPKVSDILVNGPHEVYVERGGRLEPTDIVFADNAHVMQIIQRIAARVGRRADETSPMVDARLPDGSRVNAIVPPLALQGPVLSIRRFGVRLTCDDLIANGTMPTDMLDLLQNAVGGRISMVISGGTGAGKTTLLNTLSRFIPSDERLVTIEDSAELLLQQPHVVRLETRPPNLEGIGEIKQRDLVRNALRMRPDRIIVGEVRGAEALDMLQAMSTGHEGSLTTIHANDSRDALARLEMMVMMAGFEMPVPVIRQYIASAIELVVQIARLKGGERKLMKITEILGIKGNRYVVRDLFGFRQTGIRDGVAIGEFYATGKAPSFLDRLRTSGFDLPDSLFAERKLGAATQPRRTMPEIAFQAPRAKDDMATVPEHALPEILVEGFQAEEILVDEAAVEQIQPTDVVAEEAPPVQEIPKEQRPDTNPPTYLTGRFD